MHRLSSCYKIRSALQWGPPLNGGNTLNMDGTIPVGSDTAMEPAFDRREHLGQPGDTGHAERAAWSPPVI
jgi:hypothetical protein